MVSGGDCDVRVWDVARPQMPIYALPGGAEVCTGFLFLSYDEVLSVSRDRNLRRYAISACPAPYRDVCPCALAFGGGDELAAAPNLAFAAVRRAVAGEPPLPFGGGAAAAATSEGVSLLLADGGGGGGGPGEGLNKPRCLAQLLVFRAVD